MEFAPLPTHNAKTAYGLLNAIARVVTDVPERLDMSIVCFRGKKLQSLANRGSERQIPACGTVGCIAGWTLALTGLTDEWTANGSGTTAARVVLGLSQDQEQELFFPENLIRNAAFQTPQHVADTVAHIRKFQRENKEQLQNTMLETTVVYAQRYVV